MKSLIVSAMMLLTTSAFAVEITPAHQGHQVRIDAVEAIAQGGPWLQTAVKVTATFGNACQVPKAKELVTTIDFSDNYDNLELELLSISKRVCTLEFNPVTITINLGKFTKPNDGAFDKVLVNGVETSPLN